MRLRRNGEDRMRPPGAGHPGLAATVLLHRAGESQAGCRQPAMPVAGLSEDPGQAEPGKRETVLGDVAAECGTKARPARQHLARDMAVPGMFRDPLGALRGSPTGMLTGTAPRSGRGPRPAGARRPPEGHRDGVRSGRTLALPKDTPAQYRRCWVGTMWRAAPAQCQGVQVGRSSRPTGVRSSPGMQSQKTRRGAQGAPAGCFIGQ